jgi:hypothetical protein
MGADRITNGPLNAAGTNPFDTQALILDAQNGILEFSGAAQTRRAARCVLATVLNGLALATITTAQTMLTLALGAGALAVTGRRLRVRGRILYSTTSANVATITIAITLGGVTIASITTAASNTAASVNLPVNFEFELVVSNPGANASIASYGFVEAELGTAITTAISKFLDGNVGSQDTITIGTNPAVGDTITVNGTLVTFIVNGGTPAGNQVALGTTAAGTATALYTFLAASADPNISKATWTNPSSGVVLGIANVAGFVPWATTSVPAKITFSIPVVSLIAAQSLKVTIAASGSGLPAAQLVDATVELVA